MGLSFYFDLTTLEKFFFFCAVTGGIVFLVRILLFALLGGDHDASPGPDADVAHLEVLGDSDTSFRLVSIQGLASFFIMFGLVGLALSRQGEAAAAWAVVGGLVAGAATLLIIAQVAVAMRKLQSTGNLDNRLAIGQEGRVYLTIPAEGTGQAEVRIQNRLRVMDAVSRDHQTIKTGERVRVVDVVGGSTLVVEILK